MNKKYDVVIFGGGTSGCACAYNCAKLNLKTLLVEKNNFLGGLMTGGLVVPIMKSSVNDLNCDYYKILISTANKYNAQLTYNDNNDGWLNPELLKIVLDDILTQENIAQNLDILFETSIDKVVKDEKKIKSVILKSNILSIPIVSKYYVDATGSGEFSELCGCRFLDDNKIKQQNSLRFILANVNKEKFCNFLESLNDSKDITTTYRNDRDIHFSTASTWDNNRTWKLDKYLLDAVNEGILKDSDRSYFQLFSVAGSTHEVAFNCPRINNYQDNQFLASKELIEARKAIYRLYNFAKTKLPGFENSTISSIATQTGIREERRVLSKYIYKKEDIINNKEYTSSVLCANYGIDVHSKEKNKSILEAIPQYQLPIESLMSLDFPNLFVIGKILGADFYAHSALRVQKSCMSMGEGVAKYLKQIF